MMKNTVSTTVLQLDNFLPYRISVLANRLSRTLAGRYQTQFQISIAEWRVLAVLGETPDLSAAEVADKTAMDKVAVSRAVNRLTSVGLLSKHLAEQDKRRSVLSLTTEGTLIYQQIVPVALSFERSLKAALTATELTHLHTLLAKIQGLDVEAL